MKTISLFISTVFLAMVAPELTGQTKTESLVANPDKVVVIYPAPKEETLSTDYIVEVDGKPVPVYLAQTQHRDKKPYSFAFFDFSETVTVKIKTSLPLDNLAILPAKYGIKPVIGKGEATLCADKPINISFEPTGGNTPLLLFSNTPEKNLPKKGDPNVVWFGPRVHKPVNIELT